MSGTGDMIQKGVKTGEYWFY